MKEYGGIELKLKKEAFGAGERREESKKSRSGWVMYVQQQSQFNKSNTQVDLINSPHRIFLSWESRIEAKLSESCNGNNK
jgi:hypothetical protein